MLLVWDDLVHGFRLSLRLVFRLELKGMAFKGRTTKGILGRGVSTLLCENSLAISSTTDPDMAWTYGLGLDVSELEVLG